MCGKRSRVRTPAVWTCSVAVMIVCELMGCFVSISMLSVSTCETKTRRAGWCPRGPAALALPEVGISPRSLLPSLLLGKEGAITLTLAGGNEEEDEGTMAIKEGSGQKRTR